MGPLPFSPKAVTNLNLSGHWITSLSFRDIPGCYNIMDLSHNQISTVDWQSYCISSVPRELNLQYNNISSLDDSFFDFIRDLRANSKSITIDLRNNQFTEEQKNEIRKKWHSAITMLPERIYNTINKYFLIHYAQL